MIKPILLYASDFWGCLKLPKNNPIENLQMMVCIQILGVQKQTTNIDVLLIIIIQEIQFAGKGCPYESLCIRCMYLFGLFVQAVSRRVLKFLMSFALTTSLGK